MIRVIQVICVVSVFIIGMLLGLTFPEKSATKGCKEASNQVLEAKEMKVWYTRFGKVEDTHINGVQWTVVHDEVSNKLLLHVSQGSVYELGRAK